MAKQVFIYDPTSTDSLSKVRGVGRYLQILKENFPKNTVFTDDIRQISADSILINPFFNFLRAPLVLRRIAKKQVTVIHDLIPLKYPEHFPTGLRGKINIFLNKLALKNYDLIITDSEVSKKDITNILHIEESRIKVIYPCLPKIFSTPKQISTNFNYFQPVSTNPYCLYVGDATWNKNLVNLAKAIKIINVTCVFVGKVFSKKTDSRQSTTDDYSHPWQKELKEFFKETKNDKRFIFLGYAPDDKLIQLYRRAQCNILVSRDEGFGFSYIEAASQVCPSVLSDIEVLHETSDDKGVLFANPDNPNDIANMIGEVYFNKNKRDSLGKDAKERIKYFSQNKFVKEFLKILI